MIREELLALADELGSYEDGDCEECIAYGQPECKVHLFCAEIIARYAARKVRDAVERDAEDVTTVSAYDLLSEEDREAIAWAREHGGPAAVEKRLMPEGMEWPTVDGEPVAIGERMRSCGIEDCKVVGIDPSNARLFLAFNDIEKGKAAYFPDLAKDCHRPAPKALDADGVEIRVGDRLYDTDTGCGRTVRAVNDNGTVEFDGHENRGWFGWFLTHRAPVLAADGEPLRVGETVWKVKNGDGPYHVQEIRDGVSVCVEETSCEFMPEELTHERPETWERLEEDAGKNPFDYCKDVGHRLDTCENSEAYKARDLVRRAKKLAGVDND